MITYHEITDDFMIVKNGTDYYGVFMVDRFPFLSFGYKFKSLRHVENYIDWCEDVCDPLIKSLLVEE
ncbi:MAG: hypothetical protein ACW963_06365 [Candidatus Sifarchaeia archaeon]|jgi:hypothetical protein